MALQKRTKVWILVIFLDSLYAWVALHGRFIAPRYRTNNNKSFNISTWMRHNPTNNNKKQGITKFYIKYFHSIPKAQACQLILHFLPLRLIPFPWIAPWMSNHQPKHHLVNFCRCLYAFQDCPCPTESIKGLYKYL